MAYNIARKAEPGIFLLENGEWLVDIYPYGRDGKRVRKTKKTKAEAKRYKNAITAMAEKGEDLALNKKDRRPLSELCELWHRLRGNAIKSGKSRLQQLLFLCKEMGDPPAYQFTADTYLQLREKRQKSGTSDNMCNHDLAYLKAVFSVLVKNNKIKVNPLLNITKIKIDQSPITYLQLEEGEKLLTALEESGSPDGAIIAEICLSIGCRWREAESLRRSDLINSHIQLSGTKNGKTRLLKIDQGLNDRILAGRPAVGRLFKTAYTSFERALEAAKIRLPEGQRTHVLRHSFAVHFMLDRGNILDLQKILGHQTLDMTLRYAQFHPDYLQDVATKNPMAQLRRLKAEGKSDAEQR